MLCDLVVGKKINLDYYKYCRKPFSEMTYHVRSFMVFQLDELGHNPNHGIVFKMTPYCAHVCILGWQTMFILGVFIFYS
jgi:hypothetical protein